MLDIDDFDAVFRGNIYSKGLIDEIEGNRFLLGGKLFFDRLLELLQIKVQRLYPPKSDQQLRELHQRIVNAPTALHNKHCLLFYVLRDFTNSYHEHTEISAVFGGLIHLEKRFWTFLEGLWALDHLNLETAVGYLTHPTIIPTFPDEIILALLKHKPRDITDDDHILPMAYYNSAKPPLDNEEAKKEFVKYMANRNVTETFYWIRARQEYERRHLFEILVEETLDRYTSDKLEERSARATELVGLPFDEEEERWFEEFLTEGKCRNINGARDTIMVRRIATGRLKDAANDGKLRGKKWDRVNWDILKDGIKSGLGPRSDEDSFVI
ncbi:hypothetical protein K469DRAFT_678690 [Zopfia rhizophila CBS 207.26]|uniref:ELYS-like domain-containing protein n=1 Tax=Zopfia rhizophila CBS 207.26 TaxID=1314779 RepID=A0A6A6D9Y6_9PEZI|nr:hypothetical protein K469DRAFT_678690 [Zopfia rhizophila CBS 207.26]